MIQTCTYLCSSNVTPQVKEAGNQSQTFNRKSIWPNAAHRQAYHLVQIELIIDSWYLLAWPRLQWIDAGPCRTAPGLLFGRPPPGPLLWTCASHDTAPSFSGYLRLRPWLVRLEATPRSPTHPLDWCGQTRSWPARHRSSRYWIP